ncbi:HNH endonuclease [Sphingomonas guangdongensis]|nr:HNH endonuclease signature motif containing protein [Sphingomonas guangdongensis]
MDADPLCRYCRAEGRITPATVLDHVLALSLGGTNEPANLAPACRDCNARKGVDEQRYLQRGYDLAVVGQDAALREWMRKARR